MRVRGCVKGLGRLQDANVTISAVLFPDLTLHCNIHTHKLQKILTLSDIKNRKSDRTHDED